MLSKERLVRDAHSWRNTTIAREAFRKEQQIPDDIAFFFEREPDLSYAAIAEEARRLVTGLQSLGLQAGDVVSFQFPNWREGAALDIAAAAMGLVVNPIVPIYRDAELRFILKDARTRLIFIPDQYRSIDYINMLTGLREALPELEHVVTVRASGEHPGAIRYESLVDNVPVDPATLAAVDPNSVKCRLYTSGTTGFPKAVLHSHNTLVRITDNAIEHGNLELDSGLRNDPNGAYQRLASERRRQTPFCDRLVHIRARLSSEEAIITLRDQGPGFDPSVLPDPTDPENIGKISGRGLLLIRTFMDDVFFNETGNEITLIKRRSD